MLYVLLAGYAVVFLLAAGLVPPLSDYSARRAAVVRVSGAVPRVAAGGFGTVAGLGFVA